MAFGFIVGSVFIVLAYLVFYVHQNNYKIFAMKRREHLAKMEEFRRVQYLRLWLDPDWKPSSYEEYCRVRSANSKISQHY
jgi:hypothetical protein